MKGIFIILLLICKALLLNSQHVNLEWVKQMGGSDTSNATMQSIVTDAAGNVYTTGFFKGRVDFDPGPGIVNLAALGVEDLYVSKLDSSGNMLWVRQMDIINQATVAKSKSIAVNTAGEVFITGNFFDDKGDRKCFVSKLNPSGNLVWTKEIGEFTGTSIKVDGSNNCYIAGIGSKMFITKLDANGIVVWEKEIQGINSGQGLSGGITNEALLALDASNNIYISGSFFGTVDLDPGPSFYNVAIRDGLTNPKDIFVLKLNADGIFVWAKQMGGPLEDVTVSTIIDKLGNVYTVGGFTGTVDFDPGSNVYNLTSTTGYPNTFISKLDAGGNFIWAKQLVGGTQWCYAATLDSYGNLYTTGYFKNTLDFDPGPGVYDLTTSNYDVFISKLDPNGGFIWAKQMGGSAKIISNSIIVDATLEKIYAAGYFFGGQIDFDPGPGTYSLNSGSAENIFVLKLSLCKTSISPVINASACKSYTLNTHTYNMSGVYTQTLTSATGCDSIVTLNLTIFPSSSTTIAKAICAHETFNGHTESGFYTDSLFSVNGCDSIVALQLTVLPIPSLNLGVDTSLCAGDSLLLYAGKFTSYSWQDGSVHDHITIKKPGVYAVTVTNNCGSATDKVVIKETHCDMYFPNAFTPNNDGLNDLFKIINANGIAEYHMLIYNRWGQKVFETADFLKGWNGTFEGQMQQSQTFIWYCYFKKRSASNRISMKGIVTLLR